MILAIDPGPEKSAYILWNGETWKDAAIVPNEEIRGLMLREHFDLMAIEMIASYGMAVGKSVFETCVWIGRFTEIHATERDCTPELVYRKDVKMHLCQSMRAKDANIRQALLDRFGGKDAALGKKANPGPLYGIKSHLWAALAIAIYVQDRNP